MQPSAMASRQSIRRIGKSWKFESNDFLTTPAVENSGPRPELVPIYRAYNNGFGRGIDSNHRITHSHAPICRPWRPGSIGEGVADARAPRGRPQSSAPAVGMATASPTTTNIGAGGGGLSVPGAKVRADHPGPEDGRGRP